MKTNAIIIQRFWRGFIQRKKYRAVGPHSCLSRLCALCTHCLTFPLSPLPTVPLISAIPPVCLYYEELSSPDNSIPFYCCIVTDDD